MKRSWAFMADRRWGVTQRRGSVAGPGLIVPATRMNNCPLLVIGLRRIIGPGELPHDVIVALGGLSGSLYRMKAGLDAQDEGPTLEPLVEFGHRHRPELAVLFGAGHCSTSAAKDTMAAGVLNGLVSFSGTTCQTAMCNSGA